MSLKIGKEKHVPQPKFLLSKKEITEAEFFSMLTNNDQMLQQSHSERLISFKLNNDNLIHQASYSQLVHKDTNNLNRSTADQKGGIIEKYRKDRLNLKSKIEPSILTDRQATKLNLKQYSKENCEGLVYESAIKNHELIEKVLDDQIKEKVVQQVKRDLYENEYTNIVETIRKEVYDDIVNNFILKQQKELEQLQNKFEQTTKLKLAVVEKDLIKQYKNQYEQDKKVILVDKEKEIRAINEEKLKSMKENTRTALKDKYGLMQKELLIELEEYKTKFIESSKGKAQIKTIKKIQSENKQIQDFPKEKNEFLYPSKQKDSKYIIHLKGSQHQHQLKHNNQHQYQQEDSIQKSGLKFNLSTRNLNLKNISNSDINHLQNNNDRSVNLFELNNRIRCLSPRSDSFGLIKLKEYEYNSYLPIK